MDLIDVFKTFHSMAEEYTSLSSAHGTFISIDNILYQKSSHSKFKKIEIISGIFSNHKTMRKVINYRETKLQKKNTSSWRLNNTFLSNEEVTGK